MKKQVFLKWVSCVVIVALGMGNLTGCGGAVYLGGSFRGVRVSQQTRETDTLTKKDVELSATATAVNLSFDLSYQPYYQTESRSTKRFRDLDEYEGLLFLGLLFDCMPLALYYGVNRSQHPWETYQEFQEKEKEIKESLIRYYTIASGLTFLGWVIRQGRTSPTPWKPSGTKPGPSKPIRNHPVSISLPQFQYQGSYRTNAAGRLIIPADDLISRISSLDPILLTSSIKVDASTNLEGQTHQQSFTMARSSGLFRTLYNEANKLRQAPPADLITTAAFSDTDALVPNNALDAGEQRGKLHLTVTNQGQGPGFDVRLHLSADHPGVQLAANTKALGTIQPNRKATAIGADYSQPRKLPQASPTSSSRPRKSAAMTRRSSSTASPSAGCSQPSCRLAVCNSTTTSRAMATAFRKTARPLNSTYSSTTAAPAMRWHIRLELVNAPRGLDVQVRSANLGTIRANKTAQGVLRVGIPRTFAGSALAYELRLSGPRLDAVSQAKSHPIQQRAPHLVIADRFVTDTNGDGKMQQGESVEFELTVANRGQLAAMNARLTVAAEGHAHPHRPQ